MEDCSPERPSVGALALNPYVSEEQNSKESFSRHLTLVDGKIKIYEATTYQQFELFVNMKDELYRDDPNWPGQKAEDTLMYLEREQSPYSSYLDIKPFMAVRDGQVVGRVCAIVNEHHNLRWGENLGFFGFFECINDQEVANELLGTVEKYLKARGKTGVRGPISPTIQDEVGVLTESFDKIPAKGMAYNPPYYASLFENYGFETVKNLIQMSGEIENVYKAMESKVPKLQPFFDDENIYARQFDWNNFEEDAELVRDLFYNQTFYEHWGFYPTEPKEWCMMLESYRPYIYDDLFLIIEDAGEPIGFGLCFCDYSHIMHGKRHGYEGQVIRQKWDLAGIKPAYHRNGLGTYIAYNLMPGLKAHDTQIFCGSWALEENVKSHGLLKGVGMEICSRYRVFQKNL